jgi:hypothetical protein
VQAKPSCVLLPRLPALLLLCFLQVRDHVVRPHIEELLRLLPHFRLGVFSSATTRTVKTALGVIHRRLHDIARAKGLGGCAVASNASERLCVAVSGRHVQSRSGCVQRFVRHAAVSCTLKCAMPARQHVVYRIRSSCVACCCHDCNINLIPACDYAGNVCCSSVLLRLAADGLHVPPISAMFSVVCDRSACQPDPKVSDCGCCCCLINCRDFGHFGERLEVLNILCLT